MPENESIHAKSGKEKNKVGFVFKSLVTERCDELRPTRAAFKDVPLYKIDRMSVLQLCFRAAHYRKKGIFKRKGNLKLAF